MSKTLTKPAKLNITTKVDNASDATGKFTAAEANAVFGKIDAIIDNYQETGTAPTSHKASHENGGGDEISVAGLSGELADAQTPKSHGNEAHSSTFITSAALSGYEQQTNKGDPDGYAPLDEEGKVPNTNLPYSYGDTKLWNITKNDVPSGWHVCDGSNGTEDLSAVNPSVNTVYIMYIGGETVTARTLNITNDASSVCSYTLKDAVGISTITKIEDGAPFKLSITNTSAGDILLNITCTRSSDGCIIFTITNDGFLKIGASNTSDIFFTQYVDCTWLIEDYT